MADERAPGDADERELARVARDLLPSLITRFRGSELGELEIRRSGWRVRLRRENGTPRAMAASLATRRRATLAVGAGGDGFDPGGALSSSAADGVGAASGGSDGNRVLVRSPAVGYFQPAGGVDVGQNIRSGDVVGHVEVLGVRQDAVAVDDGVVSRLLAQPGEAVEYGQELVRIDRPSGSAGRVDDGRGTLS